MPPRTGPGRPRDAASDAINGQADPAASPERRRVLLLESDPNQAETLAASLEYAGYACEVAERVEEARAAMVGDGARFAALITDLALGPVDGIAFIEEARALPGYAALPAIVTTGHSGAAVRARVEALGRTGYLLKPFTISSALSLLAQLLDGAGRDS